MLLEPDVVTNLGLQATAPNGTVVVVPTSSPGDLITQGMTAVPGVADAACSGTVFSTGGPKAQRLGPRSVPPFFAHLFTSAVHRRRVL